MGRKEQALAYVNALEVGAIEVGEIVSWADSIIEIEEKPQIEFIELAMVKTQSDAVTWLNKIAVGASIEESVRRLFGIYEGALENEKCTYEDIARQLFFMASRDERVGQFTELFGYWNDLDLAEMGGWRGSLVEVQEEMLGFFKKNKA